MELDLRSEFSLPSHESVLEEIVNIRKELYYQIVIFIRNMVGNIQGLRDDQVYMKFKLTFMELHFSLIPRESSLPIVFLEVFVSNLVDWLAHLRLQKIFQIEEYIKKMKSSLYKNGIHFFSSNDDSECVEIQSECNESRDNDNFSSKCEDMDSNFSELDYCS